MKSFNPLFKPFILSLIFGIGIFSKGTEALPEKSFTLKVPFDTVERIIAGTYPKVTKKSLAIVRDPLENTLTPKITEEKLEVTNEANENLEPADIIYEANELTMRQTYVWAFSEDGVYGNLELRQMNIKVNDAHKVQTKPKAIADALTKRKKAAFHQMWLTNVHGIYHDSLLRVMNLEPQGNTAYRMLSLYPDGNLFYERIEQEMKKYQEKIYQAL